MSPLDPKRTCLATIGPTLPQSLFRKSSSLRDVRWPVVDRFDIETSGRCKGSDDRIEFVTRDNIVDPGETVRCALFCELHSRFGSKIAVSLDDIVHGGAALGVIAFQRSHSIIGFHQGPGQRARVKDGLGAGLATYRLHGLGGIAEQRDAAERPSGDRIAIDQWKLVDRG